MKRIKLLLYLLVLGISANSQSLLVDEFEYSLTDLLGQGNWAITLAGAPNITVTPPTISYPNYPSSGVGNEITLSNSGQDLNKLFPSQTTGTIYTSFIVKINSATATGDYFINLSSSPMLTSNFVSRVYVKSSGSKFAFGIARFTSVTYTGFDYDLNTPYLIVMKYEINAGNSTASIIVNPVLSVNEPTSGWFTSTVGAVVPSNIGSICIRQGTSTSAPTLNLDGLHIGTSWSDLFSASIPLGSASIRTQTASTVNSNSAILNGTIVSLGNSAITSYGFCWNTTGTPTILDTKIDKGAISATGSFTHNLTGLTQGTKYYVRAYATNADSTTYGSVVEFTTLGPTDPGTANLTHQWTFDDETANDAIGTVNGVLQGGAIINNKALKTSTSGDYLSFNGAELGLNSYTSLSTEIWFTSSAGSNTGATMLSYIGNSIGNYGYNYIFTTASNSNKSRTAISCGNTSSPWTAENGVNSLKYDDGLQHQMVSVLNSSGITFYVDGVKIGTTAYTGSNNIASIGTSLAYLAKSGYSTDPTWIGSIHKYSIYNKALTDNEVIYLFNQGAEKANGVDLATSPASSITAASATFNGTMTLSGSTSVSSYGFCWNSTGAPTILNNKIDLGASSTSGTFTKDITGLLGATTYYVRSYATVNGLTVYGNVQSFTTALPDAYTITLVISTGGAVIDNTVSLSNGNVVSVNRGTTKTFTFIPDTGYKVVGLTYNGVDVYSQIVNNQYTTAAVNAYGVLSVAFGNGIKTIHLASAGTLSSMLSSVEKSSITSLTITGNIDARDIKCMRDEMPLLSTVDLKDASIIAYTGNGGTYFTTFSSTYPANQMPIYSFTDIQNGTGSKMSLVNVKLPNSLTSIGREAFNNCNNLKTLTIGRLVTSIDDMAFFDCNSINTIKCLSQTPPTLGISSFDMVSPAVVFVPVGKVPIYKAATGWSAFNIVEYKIKPTTQAATAIKLVTAKLNGSVDVITDSPVTAHGFCWNTTGTPTIADSKVDNGAKTTEGSFSNEISGLTEATTYYVRAYATDGTSGTVYGEEISFSTAETPTSSIVGGNYYNSQYWSLSKSPYTITSNVNLAEGTTLTIEPGVVVNFAGDYEILAMGSIIAEGTGGLNITTNNGRIMFRKTNLSFNSLKYLKSNGTKIQLANESEFTHDSPTNSDTLRIYNSIFINAQVITNNSSLDIH